jgi:hypothetical protein
MTSDTRPDRLRTALWIVVVVALLAVAGVSVWWASTGSQTSAAPAPPTASGSVTSTPTPSPTPTPTPTPTGFAANTTVYPLDALPQVDVYAVIPALPVDDDPQGAMTGDTVRAATERIPVFADPTADPVASLPRDYQFDGTTVPVVERQEHWVRVLLTGREAVPSAGNPAQLSGWLRTQDVEFTRADATVEVGLTTRTIDIVHADGTRERVADDFGSGTASTPTPIGRTFVMMVRVEPSFGYTRGHPLVYLGVQSPTLDGFGGAAVAVTAFHYHDARSGAISNGCLRLGPEAIDRLAQLPLGTAVYVTA